MEFLELLQKRHSVRAYEQKEVDEKLIDKIIELAKKAPSAGHLASFEIIKVKDQALKEKFVEATRRGQKFIAEAPFNLVFCADLNKPLERFGERGQTLYCIQDATIACVYAQLIAVELGLSSVWVGSFDEEKVSEVLNLSKNLRPIAILPIGYERL